MDAPWTLWGFFRAEKSKGFSRFRTAPRIDSLSLRIRTDRFFGSTLVTLKFLRLDSFLALQVHNLTARFSSVVTKPKITETCRKTLLQFFRNCLKLVWSFFTFRNRGSSGAGILADRFGSEPHTGDFLPSIEVGYSIRQRQSCVSAQLRETELKHSNEP